jgi:flagellar basal-body rod protein FlgB
MACVVLYAFIQTHEVIIMAINFNEALGIHPQALTMREKRSEVLATNLANSDTPGYKARDLDFKSILKQNLPPAQTMERTQAGHFASQQLLEARAMYRNPNQVSLDGNTVEANVEQAKYAENAVQYQASLQFISNDFSGLMMALRGQ